MIHHFRRKFHNLISDKRFSEILSGSAWALGARVIGTSLGLTSSIIIARFFGPEVMGIVAVINSFVLLTTIFTTLGTNTSILRLIPEHLAKYSPTSAFRVYRKTEYMAVGASLFTGSLLYFASSLIANRIFSKPHLSSYFALATGFIVFRSVMVFNTQAVRGLKLIRTFAFMQLLPQASNLAVLVLLSFLCRSRGVPVYALLCSFAISGIIGLAITELSFRKIMEPNDYIKPVALPTVLSISLPMLLTSAMVYVIGQTGVIILGMFRSEAEVGYFAIAVKLATLTTFILNAINSMAAPKFSELFHSGKMEEVFYVAKRCAKLIFWTTTPILLGLIIFGKPVLDIAFGREFVLAYPAMVLLVLGQFVNSISGSTGFFMNMTGNQKIFGRIMLYTALGNVGLNLLLIPAMGIRGAAVSTMASLIVWNTATLAYIKIKYGKTTGYFPVSL